MENQIASLVDIHWLTVMVQWASAFLADMPGEIALMAKQMGPWLYVVIALIVFAETGLVVTPFLPGDSLLFAVGSVVALAQPELNIGWMALVLVVAAILGDAVNYTVGSWAGPRLFRNTSRKWLNEKHLEKTRSFYEKHGGKAIILARFVPIVRTYAPFVAGIGKMEYRRFALFNVVGAIAWVLIFLFAGYWFGNHPKVKTNFQYIILAIIVLSVLPILIEWLKSRSTPSSEKPQNLKSEKFS